MIASEGKALEGRALEAKRPLDALVVVAAIIFIGLAVLLESRLRMPLRLPGHRSFPGAMALLLVARCVPGLPTLLFAAVIGGGVALMSDSPMLAVVWLVPGALLAMSHTRTWQRHLPFMALIGATFGLVRYLALPEALHYTPQPLRLGGHLFFGFLGALAAWGLIGARNRSGATPACGGK